MKKLLSVCLTVMLISLMAIGVNASSSYGDLGWSYPLDSSYTEYYRGYSSSTPHWGLDLKAPSGANIYSVDSGTVKFSGYSSSTGYYVVVSNSTRVTGISNPLYVRYIHMDNAPEVATNDSVSAGQTVGYVGSDGAYIGSKRVPHLHMDVNTIKATGGGKFSSSNTIDPMLFFPSTSFSRVKSQKMSGAYSATLVYADNESEAFDKNKYIDTHFIRYVGKDVFSQWCKQMGGMVTIQAFKAHFGISNEQFNNLLNLYGIESIYQ